MTHARSEHSATLLTDGRVLIVGGGAGSGWLASAELYDPKTGSFSPTGSMKGARGQAGDYGITVLSDGRVLIAGGFDGTSALASAELYDPKTGKFRSTGSMSTPRNGTTATLLGDGRVLIAGGGSEAELYDPKTGRFSLTGSMITPRLGDTATLLSDGRVLIVGGVGSAGALASAELYDPKTGSFSPTGPMTVTRSDYCATLLSDGRVLIVGGIDQDPASSGFVASAELYDPGTGSFSPTGPMTFPYERFTATLLMDGRVLIAGYGSEAQLYDPKAGTFSSTSPMTVGRKNHAATLLQDGRVLITGGDSGPNTVASAELFKP